MASIEEQPLLSCRNVFKYFGAMAAVNDFSVDVSQGEVVGIGGPNGAGKTTLLDVISGLNPASSGEIRLAGASIEALPAHRVCHRGVARTFQMNAAFDSLSVWDNVMVAATFGLANAPVGQLSVGKDAKRRTENAIALVGLEHHRDSVVMGLPVLDRKLLMLASAMASEPKLLLIDEPVGGLNPSEIDAIMDIVRRLAGQGVTIILIEHVMRFLLRLSTRVLILQHGEAIYDGEPKGLVQDKRVVEVYLGEDAASRLQHVFD